MAKNTLSARSKAEAATPLQSCYALSVMAGQHKTSLQRDQAAVYSHHETRIREKAIMHDTNCQSGIRERFGCMVRTTGSD